MLSRRPTMLSRNRDQWGYQKSDPGGDHYYVGCLGQTQYAFRYPSNSLVITCI